MKRSSKFCKIGHFIKKKQVEHLAKVLNNLVASDIGKNVCHAQACSYCLFFLQNSVQWDENFKNMLHLRWQNFFSKREIVG
jgi:hypothetical protein